MVEQLICNQQVVGSNPTAGSLDYEGFTQDFGFANQGVFAICLALLRRKGKLRSLNASLVPVPIRGVRVQKRTASALAGW